MVVRVLILGGMHGNEMLGVKLVASLQSNPIKGVDAMIANPRAVDVSRRFVETDLNRSFGVDQPVSLEELRAVELAAIVRDYDIVLDFHNTQTPRNNCCFVGIDCDPILYEQVKRLGFETVIEATYDCINKYHSNALSIEISINDTWDSVGYWRERLEKLTDGDVSTRKKVQLYRFDSRVTWQQFEQNKYKEWLPFKALSTKDKMTLGKHGVVAPIFIGSMLTPYYATLVRYIKQV